VAPIYATGFICCHLIIRDHKYIQKHIFISNWDQSHRKLVYSKIEWNLVNITSLKAAALELFTF